MARGEDIDIRRINVRNIAVKNGSFVSYRICIK
jgi:hypothetical protein